MKMFESGSIRIADIEIGKRLRQLDENVAQALAAIIGKTVLLHPVQAVKKGNHTILAAGRHRLRAFEILKRTDIPCIVWEPEEGEDVDKCIELIEVIENLGRDDLNPLDRAAFVARMYDLLQQMNGEKRGGDRSKTATVAALQKDGAPAPFLMADEVAARVGLSPRTIFADLALHKGLSDATRKSLAGTPIASQRAQLIALSRETPEDQKAILALILKGAEDAPKTVGAAAALHHNLVQLTDDEKVWKAFEGLWARASNKAKAKIIAKIAPKKAQK